MEREYFDAKFEGLKELMVSQQNNLHDHIIAVSTNVKRVESDLNAHKVCCPPSVAAARLKDDLDEHVDSIDAHGRKATDKFSASAIAWLSLALASLAAIFEFKRHP